MNTVQGLPRAFLVAGIAGVLVLVLACNSASWIQGTWRLQLRTATPTTVEITDKTITVASGRARNVSGYTVIEASHDRVAIRLEDGIPLWRGETALEITRWHREEKIKIDGTIVVRERD